MTGCGSGPVRVCSSRGRARVYDLAITHAVEEFHVDVWPEPELREPQVLRKESAPF
jgi:hypothetical protein